MAITHLRLGLSVLESHRSVRGYDVRDASDESEADRSCSMPLCRHQLHTVLAMGGRSKIVGKPSEQPRLVDRRHQVGTRCHPLSNRGGIGRTLLLRGSNKASLDLNTGHLPLLLHLDDLATPLEETVDSWHAHSRGRSSIGVSNRAWRTPSLCDSAISPRSAADCGAALLTAVTDSRGRGFAGLCPSRYRRGALYSARAWRLTGSIGPGFLPIRRLERDP